MLSGRRLDLLDPSPLDVEIEDIAHGLARVARWNGQTVGPHIFSVAQHSLLVERIAGRLDPSIGRAERLFLLLHDAPEYVIGDMISPFKAVIGDAYKAVEARILGAVLLRFSLPATPSPEALKLCKRADRAAAFFEATQLAGFTRADAERIFGRPPLAREACRDELAPLPIEAAQARFLARFKALDAG
jgi:5'-deoxynucleotidase YfbR-like HD superfamily hydrolase